VRWSAALLCARGGERIGEHDGERVARSIVANCAEPFGSRVTASYHAVIAAAQGD
jgi:hypothetical protein